MLCLILGQDGSDIKVNDWIVSQKFEKTCSVKLTNITTYEEGRFFKFSIPVNTYLDNCATHHPHFLNQGDWRCELESLPVNEKYLRDGLNVNVKLITPPKVSNVLVK